VKRRRYLFAVLSMLFILLFSMSAFASRTSESKKILKKTGNYVGQESIVLNGNKPFFAKSQAKKWKGYSYSSLDKLGRCYSAKAVITPSDLPTEERGYIGSVKPSGWPKKTVKYDFIDGKYLYNRCHLIAYCLGGGNANVKNLITGTRQMNLAMLVYETKIVRYIENTGDTVYYRVTPVFSGKNLVASGVLMEAQSKTKNRLRLCVYVYNVQDGVKINYKTGESSATGTGTNASLSSTSLTLTKGESTSLKVTGASGKVAFTSSNTSVVKVKASGKSAQLSARKAGSATITVTANGQTLTCSVTVKDKNSSQDTTGSASTYILNTSSKKIHLPDCSAVKKMAEKNKQETNASLSDLVSQGYDTCKMCLS